METPRSLDVANKFMSEGRGGSVDHTDVYPMDLTCNPQNVETVGPYKLDGSKAISPDVNYDPYPKRLNPRSVSNQEECIHQDAEGRPIKKD